MGQLGLSSLRQSGLMEAIHKVIDIFIAEVTALPEYCAACPRGIDAQNFGGLCACLFEPSQLSISCGQPRSSGTEVGSLRDKFAERHDRFRVPSAHIVG